eukprot:PITA_01030
MAHELCNDRNIMFSSLQPGHTKRTVTIHITTHTTQLQQLNVNTKNSSCEDIRTLCKEGQLRAALHILQRTYCADSSTYSCLLQRCIDIKTLAEGKLIQAHIIQTRFKADVSLATKLVVMYGKCGSLVDARHVLDKMSKPNVVSSSAMVAAYARRGFYEEALALYYDMQKTGTQPNHFTFTSVLSACANLVDMEHGKRVHHDIIASGLQCNAIVGSALVNMYAKCGSIENAQQVFDRMPERNVVSWNIMISGYVEDGNVDEAMKLFLQMSQRDVVSWTAIIAGYARKGYLDEAMELFLQIPERNVVSWNSLIAGYAQHGHFREAQKLFDEMPERNVISWNAMIAGYTQSGHFDEALGLLPSMQLSGVKANSITFTSILPACSHLPLSQHGEKVHASIIKNGIESDIFVGNGLVDMYSNCGSMVNACKVFEKMPRQDVVSWSLLISGYVRSGYFDVSLKLFQQMKLAYVRPTSVTFASVLPAFANIAILKHGKEVHEDIIRSGFQSDMFVENALVDMYAKCGSIEDAHKMFSKMSKRDVVSWTSIIVGCAIHGFGKEALQLFEQMQHSGIKPNSVTFVGVLFACGHAGLVDHGWKYFHSMSQDYNIIPTIEHYCCMVDLLGRAGNLYEAHNFISSMPLEPDAAVWGSFLSACRIHNNIELARHAADWLFESNRQKSAHYMLLSNIYAEANRWDEVEKETEYTHEQEIYVQLEKLDEHMQTGYAPNPNFVLHDVDEEQKKHAFSYHSDKLAIEFGLINTWPAIQEPSHLWELPFICSRKDSVLVEIIHYVREIMIQHQLVFNEARYSTYIPPMHRWFLFLLYLSAVNTITPSMCLIVGLFAHLGEISSAWREWLCMTSYQKQQTK